MKKNTGTWLNCVVLSSCLAWTGLAGAEVSFTLGSTLNNPTPQADARFGYSVAGVGDMNNDGALDCLVGVPRQNILLHSQDFSNAGQAFVFNVADGSLVMALNNPKLNQVANFGRAVAAVGDINSDGRPDVLVGAPGDVMAGKGKKKGTKGKAYVFAAVESNDGSTAADLRLTLDTPTHKDARFGYALAGVGDVTGDGVPDFLVGTPWQEVNKRLYQGKAFVFSGAGKKPLKPWRTLNNPDNAQAVAYFAQAVAGIGDVNTDGVPDLLVGAPFQDANGNNDQGQVFIFSGKDGSLLSTLDHPNPQAGASFGHLVADAGDVNGDGVADLIAGAPFQDVDTNSDQGQAYIFSGKDGSLLNTLNNPSPQEKAWFGSSAISLGDVNGDHAPDILLGAPAQDVAGNIDQGQVFIFSGADGNLLHTLDNPTPQSPAYFGLSVAAPGDVNGDQIPDLLIGAPAQKVNDNAGQGQVFVFTSSVETD